MVPIAGQAKKEGRQEKEVENKTLHTNLRLGSIISSQITQINFTYHTSYQKLRIKIVINCVSSRFTK